MPNHLIDSLPTTAATPYPVVAFSGFEVIADESLMRPAVKPDDSAPAATAGSGLPVATETAVPTPAPTPVVQTISFIEEQPISPKQQRRR